MNSSKIAKYLFIISMILTLSASVFAADKTDYEELAATGTAQEIQRTFKSRPSLKSQTFGTNKETFVMLVLKNNRSTDIIRVCIIAECDMNAKTKDKRTPLMYAAEYSSYPAIIETIVKSGNSSKTQMEKKVQAKDVTGKTAFDYAKKNSAGEDIYNVLLKFGTDPAEDAKLKAAKKTKKSSDKKTAASATPPVASENNNENNIEENNESDSNSANESVETSLNSNSSQSYPNQEDSLPRVSVTPQPSVQELEAQKAADAARLEEERQEEERKKKIELERLAAEKAARDREEARQRELAEELKKESQKAQIKQYTQTFLYDYEEEPSAETIENPKKTFKIENPNLADANGVTLLMKAAKAGNDWDVKNLIASGADVQMRDKDGWTALMYAVRYQHSLEIVKTLVDNGAYVRVRNKYNATPLLLAADYNQNPQILELLLKNRSVNEDEVFKSFIFAITGNSGSDHIRNAKVQLYLDRDIQINRIWKDKTPLMYASQYGSSTAVIQQLLDNGAKPGIKDSNGKTAFDFAKTNSKLKHDNTYWALNSSAK